jgi:Family of unknown function (DUF5519)
MKLEEKGPIKSPPKLDKFSQQVSTEVQSWKDIIAATHWDLYNRTKPDGADFYVGETELGHIHLNGEVHLACGKKLATLLIKLKLANKFMYGNDWVTCDIASAEDARHAIWLFKLNYRQIKGASIDDLMHDIEGYTKVS